MLSIPYVIICELSAPCSNNLHFKHEVTNGCLLKGAMVGLLISILFATCWEMLFQVFRLGYMCLGQVCLGLVSGATVCISLF